MKKIFPITFTICIAICAALGIAAINPYAPTTSTDEPLRYVAILSAEAEAAPTVEILVNTLGVTNDWVFDGGGIYVLGQSFLTNKTTVFAGGNSASAGTAQHIFNTGSMVTLVTATDTPQNVSIKIEYYP